MIYSIRIHTFALNTLTVEWLRHVPGHNYTINRPLHIEDCLQSMFNVCFQLPCVQGGISSSVLSVFFTDKFALSQSDARLSVAYNSCQWKTLTKHLMKCPPDLITLIGVPRIFFSRGGGGVLTLHPGRDASPANFSDNHASKKAKQNNK